MGCNGCHGDSSHTYEARWGTLIQPPPHLGGTATNNSLIQKASGNNHAGGDRCGGINGGVCAKIQAWWQAEFGGN